MNRPPSAYSYDVNASRFRARNGRFVSAQSVRDELDKSIDASAKAMREASEALRAGRMSLSQWELTMANEIRNSHMSSGALAKGGWAQVTRADERRIATEIRSQYKYLQQFAADIRSGKQKMDGTLNRRASLYVKDARILYHDEKRREAETAGRIYIRSRRHARDSCSDCIYFNGRIYKIGDPAYISVGRRKCRGNCLCSEDTLTEAEAIAA